MSGITSLKEKRVRGDMTEVYKLMTGKEQISPGQFFTPAAREWSTVGTDYQQKMF